MFFIFGGLPAVGKTTIAKKLAQQLKAAYIRIDTIEQTLLDIGAVRKENMEGKGYNIAYSIAKENIRNKVPVIVDCVNPIEQTRKDFRSIALDCHCKYLEIEVICSDVNQHKLRAENRQADILSLALPTWDDILTRFYEPWATEHLILDSSKLSVKESVDAVIQQLKKV